MSIFNTLGESFLKVVLTDQEYKKLVLQEGNTPKSVKTSMHRVMDSQIMLKVKKSGNSGHVYLPIDWVGKSVVVSLVE